MANAGTVNIKLRAETAAFEAGMKKVSAGLSGLQSSLNLVKGVAAGFLAWKATDFVRGQMDAIDVTAKLSDRLGLTTERMVGLQHAGELAGVGAETIAGTMEKMAKNLSEVGAPAKAVEDSLAAMKLTMADMRGLSPDQQFMKIADGLNNVAGAGQRTAVAMGVFGKSGAQMLPMLADGSKGLQQMQDDAKALGLTFSRVDAFKVEQANDALTRVGALFTGVFRSAAIEISPIIEGIATAFIDSANAAGGFGDVAYDALEWVAKGVGIALDAWNVLKAAWHAGATAVKMIGWAFVKAADDIVKGLQFINGVMGNVWDIMKSFGELIWKALSSPWEALKVVVANFIGFAGKSIATLLREASNVVGYFSKDMKKWINDAANGVENGANKVASGIKGTYSEAGKEIERLSGEVKDKVKNIFNVDASGSAFLQGLEKGLLESATNSAVAYTETWGNVLNQEGTRKTQDWLAKVRAISEQSAKDSQEKLIADRKAREDAANLEQYNSAMAAAQKLWEDLENGWAASGQRIKDQKEKDGNWFFQWFRDEGDRQKSWDEQTNKERIKTTKDYMGQAATLMNSHSRKMFEIGKVAAIANATISVAQGVAKALDLGFPMGLIAAGIVAAAGAVQISTIASTQFGGGGRVSSVGGNVSIANPMGTQAVNQGAVQPNVNRLEVSIVGMSDDQLLTGAQVRRLIEQLNEAQEDGATLEVTAA
jgi:hypothetical protein